MQSFLQPYGIFYSGALYSSNNVHPVSKRSFGATGPPSTRCTYSAVCYKITTSTFRCFCSWYKNKRPQNFILRILQALDKFFSFEVEIVDDTKRYRYIDIRYSTTRPSQPENNAVVAQNRSRYVLVQTDPKVDIDYNSRRHLFLFFQCRCSFAVTDEHTRGVECPISLPCSVPFLFPLAAIQPCTSCEAYQCCEPQHASTLHQPVFRLQYQELVPARSPSLD